MKGWAQHTSRAPRRYTRLLDRLKRVNNTRHLIFINTVVKTTMYLNILIYFKLQVNINITIMMIVTVVSISYIFKPL